MRDLKKQSFNEWLIIRCQQGEKAAFTELIKNWEQRYYLYALNRLQDKEAAKDITQECLISISRGLVKLTDPAAFPKWSFRILERRCIDWLRKTIREREVIQRQEQLPEIEVHDGIESKLSVEQLLAKMDPRLATILRLYYLEDLTIDEIADINDVPSGTIKSRLFYARKLMITMLEK
ncbi:MAG: hypothetical protein COA96_18290 [SAR86 cluster bacterium]|uniref:RNA polymerase subunit sigma-24 n=1 Tax=SAR86 cluster bacterium TaxID=2030880 RepID=A0A2A5ABM2_9GAMM|nr:MAG: hypothetical protein COA96_18290 [SAR86 cluster bacterium]